MKILLLYFTGTYNTLYITSLVKNRLLSLNHNVDVINLNFKNKIDTKDYDLIGIGYPIRFHDVPKIVIDILKNVNINNKKYFIYKSGSSASSLNDVSSYRLINTLKKGNNEFIGEYLYMMPSYIMQRTKDEFVKYCMSYNIKLVKYMCDNLENKSNYKTNILKRFYVNVIQIIKPFLKIKVRKFKVDKSKCNKCRRCIKSCPTKNVAFGKNGRRIEFSNKCVFCGRCIIDCPKDAINMGKLEKYKVYGKYDFISINMQENTYDFKNEKDERYLKYQNYFKKIDDLIK